MANSSETIVKDKVKRVLGGKDYVADTAGQFLKDDAESRWLVNDGSDNRILGGKREDESFGIDVSQEGHDVLTADLEDLVLTSKNNMFKVVQSGTFAFNWSIPLQGPTLATGWTVHRYVAHNLGYIPSFIVFIKKDGEYQGLVDANYAQSLSSYDTPANAIGFKKFGFVWIRAYSKIRYFHVKMGRLYHIAEGETMPAHSGNEIIKYYLWRETANG